MALKIRLRQQGRKNRRMYRLVVADERAKRDGKYVESLGWYNPHESSLDKQLFVDAVKTEEWLGKGAQLTESTRSLVTKGAPELMQRVIKQEAERKEKIRQKRKASRNRRAEKRKASKEVAPKAQKPAAKKPAAKKPAVKKTEVKAEEKSAE